MFGGDAVRAVFSPPRGALLDVCRFRRRGCDPCEDRCDFADAEAEALEGVDGEAEEAEEDTDAPGWDTPCWIVLPMSVVGRSSSRISSSKVADVGVAGSSAELADAGVVVCAAVPCTTSGVLPVAVLSNRRGLFPAGIKYTGGSQ